MLDSLNINKTMTLTDNWSSYLGVNDPVNTSLLN